MFRAVQAKGQGYALSTEEELQFTLDVAQATGQSRGSHVLYEVPLSSKAVLDVTPS